MSEEPSIDISFSEFLEYVLEDKEKGKVKRPYHAALLLAADPSERYIHVEFPDQHNSLETPIIWRIRDWRESFKRQMQLREISEIESQWRFKRDECIEELSNCIFITLGGEKEWCYRKADQIYSSGNVNAARMFGCDKLQDVIDSKPESLRGKVEIRL